jgi:hypothetical protein
MGAKGYGGHNRLVIVSLLRLAGRAILVTTELHIRRRDMCFLKILSEVIGELTSESPKAPDYPNTFAYEIGLVGRDDWADTLEYWERRRTEEESEENDGWGNTNK